MSKVSAGALAPPAPGCDLVAMPHPAFDLIDELPLPTGMAQHLRHRERGAEVVALSDGRAESCFSISFATRPTTDNGVAHVLEHLVFRGSKASPDDQLYTALKSGSLASHLNASTRATTTSYQLASPVEDDLRRSEAILLEAVFHPLLRPEAFAQEAFAWEGGRPTGVVFHEMSGHLSRPDARLELGLRRALFGALPQGRCYGGDPASLAELTPEAVEAFHRTFYCPENALVLLTGSAALGPRLEALDRAIRACPPRAAKLPEIPQTSPRGVALALGDDGPSALGWSLLDVDLCESLLLAEILRTAAGPGLWPDSGLVADGPQSYLQLISSRALTVSPKSLASRLNADNLASMAERCLKRHLDETADFRLPAGLQARPWLLGAWQQGGRLLSPLALSERLSEVVRQPEAIVSRLRDALLDLPPPVLAETPEPPHPSALPKASPAVSVVKGQPSPGWKLPPLPRARLPQCLPAMICEDHDGLLSLPDPADGLLRICIGIDCGGVSGDADQSRLFASLSQRLLGDRFALSTRPGPERPVLLTLKLREAELPATLAEMAVALSDPFTSAELTRSEPPHLALARALREAYWEQRPAQTGPALQITSQRLIIAVNRPAAISALARFREALPQGSEATLRKRNRPTSGRGFFEIKTSGLALPLAGRAADLGGGSLSRAWLALRSIEHGLLWPRLRVAGGAYGLRVSMDGEGIATMVTAQDPNPWSSLKVMEKAGDWLAQSADAALLEQGRIAALGQMLAPLPPGLRLEEAVLARMAGRPIGWQQRDLDAVLSCTVTELQGLGEALGAAIAAGPSAIMAAGAVAQA